MVAGRSVLLALTGDVMLGRGVDQIMPEPVNPVLYETWVESALRYVELAEARSGPVPRNVEPSYVWGETLSLLEELGPDVRVVNLETAITDRGEPWPNKGIHYRMSPSHVGALVAGGVDVAVLANNHVLDWSLPGLEQTLDTLERAGILAIGAGCRASRAWAPAVIPVDSGTRILIWAMGSPSSGVPLEWAARDARPGIALIPDFSDATVAVIAERVRARRRSGDLVVASIHWGGNWGYRVETARRRFAHQLIERAGVDLVHGHSSHHPLGMEIHNGHLILYGCGDLITDYEGITGHEGFRNELGAIYLPRLDPGTGQISSLDLVPTKVERFRLIRPSDEELTWFATTLARESTELGCPLTFAGDTLLHAAW